MNKKTLFIAAVAAMLSVTGANATEITGVTGSGNVFDINPLKSNGDVGYRQYDKFNLSQGDIANLIFKHGGKDLETFINMVDNQVVINGILNSVRDGAFHNGHAIFISPEGMVVGASGVLNVGSLSVATPTTDKYNALKGDYDANDYTNINQISNLLNKQANEGNIQIDGKVFARNGVQLRGAQVNVGAEGAILNGVAQQQALNSSEQAAELFNQLVNTEGMINTGSQFVANGSNIQIKSSTGTDIAGKVINGAADPSGITETQGNSGVFITNSGDQGTKISGLVQSTNELNVYNKAGELNITGTVKNENSNMNISNAGTNLSVGGNLSTDHDLAITNNGTGALTLSGKAVSEGKTDIVNEGAGGMNITGTVGSTATPSVRIVNRGGKMVIANSADAIKAEGTVRLENTGSGGMEVAGVKGGEKLSIENKAGDLTINGDLSVDDGAINILNSGNKLAVASKGNIKGNGTVSVKNRGAGGMAIDGTISNDGIDAETAINNENGAMLINGKINNIGNMAIENRGSGTGMTITKNAVITNEGKLKLKNYGQDGMSIVGTVDNTGDLTVYNDNGLLALKQENIDGDEEVLKSGEIHNRDGRLIIWSRENSTGISTNSESQITNEGAGYSLAIKHTGKTAEGNRGMDLQGTISNEEGDTAINNYSGDMYVSGNITTDGNLGIINREGGGEMTLASNGTITSDTGNMNIKNYGSGDMTVNNTITHGGRVNVLANSGKLNLGGTVVNNSNGELDDNNGFYAAARENGTGINVTSGFKGSGDGQYLIKNISGSEGLRYEGTINSGAQAELYNKQGNMTAGGTMEADKAILLNTGEKMAVTSTVTGKSDVKVVNKGTEAADVDEANVKSPLLKWFYEKLKASKD